MTSRPAPEAGRAAGDAFGAEFDESCAVKTDFVGLIVKHCLTVFSQFRFEEIVGRLAFAFDNWRTGDNRVD